MQLPSLFGRYELLEYLGGGMSRVYRARDTLMDRPVAVKILSGDDPESKARFLHEARVAGSIQHDNIVRVFDFGECEGQPYMVMEYLSGVDLRTAIQEGRLNFGLIERLKIAIQIAEALDYIHRSGIVHRDIKPANVHLDPSGRVKLMDFGVAKTANLSLTTPGMAVGTPYYMAPEVVAGQPATKLADIYAYGVLLFELLTGLRGVTAKTVESIFYQILNTPLDEAALTSTGVPPEIRSLVMQSTAKNPNSRPQDFGIIVDTLTKYLAVPAAPQPAVPAKEIAQTPIPRRYLLMLGAALLAAGLYTAAWLWIARTQTLSKKSAESSTVTSSSSHPEIPGMIYIDGGTFLAGPDKNRATVEPFYIDEIEVTAGEFCAVMNCPEPPASPDLPMVYVTVPQARQYAKLVGKRLPTPLEWERAARGENGATYPWGDAQDPMLANVADNRALAGHHVLPAKSFHPYPEYQMVGNVWEMVEEPVTPNQEDLKDANFKRLKPPPTAQEPWIMIRGGSVAEPLLPKLVWDSVHIPERFSGSLIGFRCARSP